MVSSQLENSLLRVRPPSSCLQSFSGYPGSDLATDGSYFVVALNSLTDIGHWADFELRVGGVSAGYHLGVLNTSLTFVASDLGFSATSSGAVAVSALLVGASVGSLTAGQAADALGPGRALLWNNLSLILGAVLASSTPAGFWGLLGGVGNLYLIEHFFWTDDHNVLTTTSQSLTTYVKLRALIDRRTTQ